MVRNSFSFEKRIAANLAILFRLRFSAGCLRHARSYNFVSRLSRGSTALVPEENAVFKHWYFGHFHIGAKPGNRYTALMNGFEDLK